MNCSICGYVCLCVYVCLCFYICSIVLVFFDLLSNYLFAVASSVFGQCVVFITIHQTVSQVSSWREHDCMNQRSWKSIKFLLTHFGLDQSQVLMTDSGGDAIVAKILLLRELILWSYPKGKFPSWLEQWSNRNVSWGRTWIWSSIPFYIKHYSNTTDSTVFEPLKHKTPAASHSFIIRCCWETWVHKHINNWWK